MPHGFYITTAIDYSNGEPHVGHAFEKIGADAIARFRRMCGDDVRFVVGLDEHGQSVEQEAARRGVSPQALVDELAVRFSSAWRSLGISHDDFIRTTEPRHAAAVTALLERIREAGDLYPARYAGFYCERCEAFRKESELVDGRCPFHPSRDIQWVEEENWFFRLSRFRDPLLERIRGRPEVIRPESRRNEILRLLEGGLEDISASRARVAWGVPFPGVGGHTVYVWFDALPNYLSAIGFPDEAYRRWWPADLHVVGKDITRFHSVIWPAMLLSAGIEPPLGVWGHGFILVAGGKLSKSEAARLELPALIERHGADAFRYFLLRETPWDGDRDFPSVAAFLDGFDERYNADLANDLGNLLSRTTTMVRRFRGGEVPAGPRSPLDEAAEAALATYRERMDAYRLQGGLEAAMSVVREANGFIDRSQPWRLARDPAAAEPLDAALGSLVRSLAAVAAMLAPFMPRKAAELWGGLGGSSEVPGFDALATRTPARVPTEPGPILFPRTDTRA